VSIQTGLYAENAAILNGRTRRREAVRSSRSFKTKAHKREKEQIVLSLKFATLLIGVTFLLQIPVGLLYNLGIIEGILYWSSAMLSLSFPISVFAYLLGIKKLSLKEAIEQLGLDIKKLTIKTIGIGLLLFAIIFLLEASVSLIEQLTGIQINTNVSLLLQNAPLWFFVFTVFVAPVDEEIMFRGFFVPRLGIILSAILFAIPHLTYASTFEIEAIAAFVFGIIAGYVFKKTKSLYATILAHALVNALAIASFLI